MAGQPIAELNAGFRAFYEELQGDSLASKRVEVALISFGPVRIISNFNTVDYFLDPTLVAEGDTPLGEAIRQGIDLMKKRKEEYPGKRDLVLPSLDLPDHRRVSN